MAGDVLAENFANSDDTLLEHGFAFMGAVHSLVQTSNSATKPDLILAAITHSLSDGDKSVGELRGEVHRVWPGAKVSLGDVSSSLMMGQELGLLRPIEALDDAELWQLTPRGVQDVQGQEGWVEQLRARAALDLREKALSDLDLTITDETAELWLERIVGALIAGITTSQDAYLGHVDHLVGRLLSPRKVDRRAVLARFDSGGSDLTVLEFLKACTLTALDPLDPFGNELVSLITTGCVLHSYVAGRDSASVLDALGSPKGQRALIDTPVLLDLIGPTRVSRTVALTISMAVAAGWEVIVCEHSITELVGVVESELPRIRRSFQQAHDRGIKEEWYASLSADQLASYAVELLRDGTYKSLDQLLGAAEAISKRLDDLRVIVRPHHNENDRANVERCKAALEDELDGFSRSANAIQRDAESMAVVWRRRRRQNASTRWPGGWIITPDRHLAAPYSTLVRTDRISISMSVSQWSTLLSVTVPPTDVVSLAEAAATQLVEEAMWLLPSRYTSDVALELAQLLAPGNGGSSTDVRYAQMTLDLALDSGNNERTATAIAADVLAARTKRQEQLARQKVESANHTAAAAEASRRAAQSLAAEKGVEARSAQDEVRSANVRISDLEKQVSWRGRQIKRVLTSVGMGAGGVLALVLAILIGAWPPVIIGMVVAFLVGAWILYKWCVNEGASLSRLLWAALVQLLGIVSALVGLVVDLSG
ncbi:hypothetical protein [Microbacterium imperiale]|uniref:hypothetical protein n=1 Tax=Microbacterium imperiale TaxID=33884 RepID=UPI001AE17342|nr:hypothetical protein [Microbacterium imperiale]MBP2420716.1 hypothetical protein [Microbacterium imperiale]MDS0200623.1 hypothetical protein [Microbacterium imperiale]BFE41055.1 hypothetical protein GCM10017544_20110 [Microbacterium imperiale]